MDERFEDPSDEVEEEDAVADEERHGDVRGIGSEGS